MITRKAALPALALLAAIGTAGIGTLPARPALAQAQTAPDQQSQQGQPRERHHRDFSAARRVDARIAYLKTALKVTPAQEPQFDRVAEAMRQNAQAFDQARQQMRGRSDQQKSAVDRLEARTQFAALRAQSSQRFLDAFKPLYASLSDDQKQAADEMLSHRGHHEHGRGHGRF